VIADGFRPDVAFGFGTSGGTIALALQHYGLAAVLDLKEPASGPE